MRDGRTGTGRTTNPSVAEQVAAREGRVVDLEQTVADLVDTCYRHVDAKRTTDLIRLFAANAVYHRPGYEPIVGREALARFYAGERVIDRGQHFVENRIVSGGQIAIQGTFRGVLDDGTRVQFRFADFFRFER